MREILRRRLPINGKKTIPAIGSAKDKTAALELGAVVVMLTVTTELPFPDGTCGGLKLHDANGGKPEQDRLTAFGKFPGIGFTVTLNNAVPPRATATLGGVADIEKSKFGLGMAVKLSANECVIVAVSVPTAFRLNE